MVFFPRRLFSFCYDHFSGEVLSAKLEATSQSTVRMNHEMSAKTPQFYNKLKDAPPPQEGQLPLVTANLLKTQERRVQNHLDTSLEGRQVTFEADQYRPKQVLPHLSARALLKIAETKQAINEWLRETKQGTLEACQSESRLVTVVESALAMVDAAEDAILNAAVARIDEDRFEPCMS